MHNDTSQEKAYWSKEAAAMLNIATPTLRKYCNLMESHGYVLFAMLIINEHLFSVISLS
ncbi:hypothetical protein [Priestia aryabhattai]